MLVQATPGQSGSAHVVVLGNEKGGSGKSTIALHVAVALLKAGQRVATIDLDCRQQSFTYYIENRRAWAGRTGLASRQFQTETLPKFPRQNRFPLFRIML
jgi:chromosome partitioning protein